MEQEVPAQVADTAAPAPEPLEIVEVQDTPQGAAPVEAQVVPPQETLLAGKYRTAADLEKAYKEAERMASEKAQEAAMFRRVAEERMAQPYTPPYAPPQAPADFNEKLRSHLEEDPAGTLTSMIEFTARRMMQEQQEQQRATLARFQQFAQQPGYGDVMNEVATQLPFATQPLDPVEGAFLKARLAKLERELAARTGAPQPPMYAESARVASRPGSTGLRVEVEGDVSRIKNRLGDEFNDVARMVAKHKANGGNMDSFSIDDYMRGRN